LSRDGLEHDLQNQLNPLQGLVRIVMQKAIIPDPVEALRQHMLNDPPEKVLTIVCISQL